MLATSMGAVVGKRVSDGAISIIGIILLRIRITFHEFNRILTPPLALELLLQYYCTTVA